VTYLCFSVDINYWNILVPLVSWSFPTCSHIRNLLWPPQQILLLFISLFQILSKLYSLHGMKSEDGRKWQIRKHAYFIALYQNLHGGKIMRTLARIASLWAQNEPKTSWIWRQSATYWTVTYDECKISPAGNLHDESITNCISGIRDQTFENLIPKPASKSSPE